MPTASPSASGPRRRPHTIVFPFPVPYPLPTKKRPAAGVLVVKKVREGGWEPGYPHPPPLAWLWSIQPLAAG